MAEPDDNFKTFFARLEACGTLLFYGAAAGAPLVRRGFDRHMTI